MSTATKRTHADSVLQDMSVKAFGFGLIPPAPVLLKQMLLTQLDGLGGIPQHSTRILPQTCPQRAPFCGTRPVEPCQKLAQHGEHLSWMLTLAGTAHHFSKVL